MIVGAALLTLSAGVFALGRASGGGGVSLADRAYAATSGPGVRHWKIAIRTYIDGRQRGGVQRQEGWSRNEVLHVLLFDAHRLSSDIRSTPAGTRSWSARAKDIYRTPPLRGQRSGPLSLGDPFEQFRHAHQTGRLERLSATRYRIRPDKRNVPQGASFIYELDPKTARPLRVTLEYGFGKAPTVGGQLPAKPKPRHYRTVFSYELYERLLDTSTSRGKLQLLPHLGAGPSATDARTVYALLRNGTIVRGKPRTIVETFARYAGGGGTNPHPQAADARRGPQGVILIPGRGYLGMMRRSGGTLATVDTAAKRGLAISGSAINTNAHMYVVVPDGVRALRARSPGHAWLTFPVRQNVSVLPNGGYHSRMIR